MKNKQINQKEEGPRVAMMLPQGARCCSEEIGVSSVEPVPILVAEDLVGAVDLLAVEAEALARGDLKHHLGHRAELVAVGAVVHLVAEAVVVHAQPVHVLEVAKPSHESTEHVSAVALGAPARLASQFVEGLGDGRIALAIPTHREWILLSEFLVRDEPAILGHEETTRGVHILISSLLGMYCYRATMTRLSIQVKRSILLSIRQAKTKTSISAVFTP